MRPRPRPSSCWAANGLTRRDLLAAGAAAWGVRPARAAGQPELIIAGPDGGSLARWAAVLAPPLARGMAQSSLETVSLGGVDGVTGANQFEARAAPDGRTALLVPGDAAIAWLAGDPRVQFDAARWVAVLAGTGCGLVVGRVSQADWSTAPGLRFAGSGPCGPTLAALLALDLLGVSFTPAFGMAPADARAAVASGQAQLMLLAGGNVPEQLASLTQAGVRPLFAFGCLGHTEQPAPDPLFPGVPHLAQIHAMLRGAPPAGPLYDAWRATALGAQLAFGLMLPQLTPAAEIALWRRAAGEARETPALHTAAAQAGVRTLTPEHAASVAATLAAGPAALPDFRSWLAERWNYAPA